VGVADSVPAGDPAPGLVSPASRRGFWIAVGGAGVVVLAAFVAFVLVIALGVINRSVLPAPAAARALLTASDVRGVPGVGIDNGGRNGVQKSSLPAYVARNPVLDRSIVHPSMCADDLEGWMAWAALDIPSYPGWKHDTVYQASNIVVDAASSYGPDIQQSRNFASVAAATAFMSAERAWYRRCAVATYTDPSDHSNSATYAFSPVTVAIGLDSIIEGSSDTGRYAVPHLIDVYLRNHNVVYVLEVATNHDPAAGLDRVSLGIVDAAAEKLRSVG